MHFYSLFIQKKTKQKWKKWKKVSALHWSWVNWVLVSAEITS